MSELSNPAASSLEEAQAYIDAILGLLGERDPWSVLEATPGEVAGRVGDLDEAVLRRPEAPGFDQDLWAERLGYAEAPLADALERPRQHVATQAELPAKPVESGGSYVGVVHVGSASS